ncbi:MAG: Lpg1974 family pore-forming outer membrane protein [Chlamydiia bacterium]
MNMRYLKQLPILMASLGLYAATADRKMDMMQPEDCVELCYAGPRLDCDEYWDISAAATYFQARAQGVDIALITQDRTNFTYPVNGIGVQPIEDLNWGFKVGLGYKLFREDWKLAARYTYYNAVQNTPFEVAYGSAFIPSMYSNQFIGGNTNLVYQLFNNLELGTRNTINNVNVVAVRPSYIDKKVEISTYYGLDATFITRRTVSVFTNDVVPTGSNQRYASANGGFYQNYQKYSWWGVGPMVGGHAKYYVNYDISLYGDIYGALNYGYSRCRVSSFSKPGYGSTAATAPSTGSLVAQEVTVNNPLYQFAPEFSYQLGVNWTKVTEDNAMLLGINVGYEATYFFNVIKTITPSTAYRIEDGTGLGLQGLVIEGYVDF